MPLAFPGYPPEALGPEKETQTGVDGQSVYHLARMKVVLLVQADAHGYKKCGNDKRQGNIFPAEELTVRPLQKEMRAKAKNRNHQCDRSLRHHSSCNGHGRKQEMPP